MRLELSMEELVKKYIRTDELPQELFSMEMDVVQAFWSLERKLSKTYIKEWK